jgi:hypothetical protein
MKRVRVIVFVYVAGALTAMAVMMALRGYAPFLFAVPAPSRWGL